MSSQALLWLLFNLLSILVLAFYSMMEMACVSINKVRLQYYATKGSRRMIWLNWLLQHPAKLFGTTLIGVNIALIVGSECSREFYYSLGITPDIAPLTQVIIVIIFGELAPMFAARRYPEHVARLGIGILYTTAKLITPFLVISEWVSRLANILLRGKKFEKTVYLTQEEFLKILEERSDDYPTENDEFGKITQNIFTLREKKIGQVMEPLDSAVLLPSEATVEKLQEVMRQTGAAFVPLYHRQKSNIVGIVFPRQTIKAPSSKRLRDLALPPWFVTETTAIMQVLKQFRTNNETVAVILNAQGAAVGIVTLDDVLEEIFGEMSIVPSRAWGRPLKNLMLKDKTFPGDMSVAAFYQQYGILLDPEPEFTLQDLITTQLGHHPEKGESIYIAPFELSVKETTLAGIKTVSISTVS